MFKNAPQAVGIMRRAKPGQSQVVRHTVATQMLGRPPANKVGQYAYSNAGYIVLGAGIEGLEKTSWEALMRRHLFKPLGMHGCGFGAPATPARPDQPWGHVKKDGAFQPVPLGPNTDNPPALGPAGTVHCDLRSWTQFLIVHLGGGPSHYLKPATLKRLHTPNPASKYAYGWLAPIPKALTHAGSNQMNYAEVWLLKPFKMGFIIVTNAGPINVVSRPINQAFPGLFRRFVKPPSKKTNK